MFLTVKQNTIPDFLSALGFIAPKGLDMTYILAPETISTEAVNTLSTQGFQETPITPIKKDMDVKYLKKDPKKAYSFSATPKVVTDPSIISPEFPKETYVEPELYQPTEIKNPIRAIQIVEAEAYSGASYLLKENFCGIPKNTLFAFSESKHE